MLYHHLRILFCIRKRRSFGTINKVGPFAFFFLGAPIDLFVLSPLLQQWMVNGEICIGLFALRDIKQVDSCSPFIIIHAFAHNFELIKWVHVNLY